MRKKAYGGKPLDIQTPIEAMQNQHFNMLRAGNDVLNQNSWLSDVGNIAMSLGQLMGTGGFGSPQGLGNIFNSISNTMTKRAYGGGSNPIKKRKVQGDVNNIPASRYNMTGIPGAYKVRQFDTGGDKSLLMLLDAFDRPVTGAEADYNDAYRRFASNNPDYHVLHPNDTQFQGLANQPTADYEEGTYKGRIFSSNSRGDDFYTQYYTPTEAIDAFNAMQGYRTQAHEGNVANPVPARFANVPKKAFGGTLADFLQQYAYGSQVPVEVEGQELAETPQGTVMRFNGASHEQGGIPTMLPQGTEIYSKRVKIDGVPISDRKGKRHKRAVTLEDLMEKYPKDNLIKNTYQRQSYVDGQEENADRRLQALINAIMPPSGKKFAYGSRVGK